MAWLRSFALLLVATTLWACGSNNSNNSGGTATTPIDACIQTGTCNNTLYNNYTAYGWMAYPQHHTGFYQYYGNTPYYNYCSCPSGYRPVYNAQFGLGCYNENSFQAYSYGAAYFGYNFGTGTPQNTQWVNIPRISGYSGYNDNSCFNSVAESCYVDVANSCTVGKRCAQTAAGSRIGICVN